MQGKKFAFTILIVLAAIMAISYIASYVQLGVDNNNNFSKCWYLILTGVLYAAAVLTMPNFGKIGWYVYLLALLFTIVTAILTFSLAQLPLIFMTLFIMIYLLDEDVKKLFGVSFSVKL